MAAELTSDSASNTRSSTANGSNQTTFASGLRNPTTLAFNPSTGDLYTLVQERDGLGDRLVPDFMTRVQQGAFYGWPYAYIGQHPQPGFAQLRPDKVKASVPPDLLFDAQSSTTSYFMRAQQDLRKARHRLLGLSRITPQGAKPA